MAQRATRLEPGAERSDAPGRQTNCVESERLSIRDGQWSMSGMICYHRVVRASVSWLPVLFAGLLLSTGCRVASNQAARETTLRAGAAVVDISPAEFPVRVNAMFTERSATNTVDRLEARCLVLDDGTTRLAIVVVDSCMLPRDLIDAAKERAAKGTGIPTDRMLVSSTHTHSAPSAMGCLGSRVDPRYAAWLPARIAEVIVAANARLEPAQVGWTVVDDWDHTFNRRWIRRPDKLLTDPFGQPTVRAHMHPGHESPDATGPSGPVDPGLSVLAVRSLAGRPLAVLANYSQHYYGSPLVSSDYYGRFREHLARMLGADEPFVGIMSQGTSGDLMWMDYGAPRREIGYDAYGKEVAGRVADALRDIRWQTHVPLRMAERKLTLGFRVPDTNRLAWARAQAAKLGERLPQSQPEIYALEAIYLHDRPEAELKLQAVRIGDLGITAIPNEVFALTGLKLKAQSPLQPTFNIELANGAEGYIPPPEQHRLGGYTTWPARTAGLEEQAEPRITENLLSLLEEVSGRARRPLTPPVGPAAAAVLKAQPIAYWRLEEAAGTVLSDASGHGHTATLDGGVALYLPGVGSGDGFGSKARLVPSAFSEPSINRAVHLAGGHLRATLPGVGTHYTVSAWVWNGLRADVRAVNGTLLTCAGDVLSIRGTNGAPGCLEFVFDGGRARLTGPTPLDFRRWHQVTLVRDGADWAVYLDGRRELTGRGGSAAGLSELRLGGGDAAAPSFEGKLDEISVFARALSASEIGDQVRAAGVGN